MISAAIAAIMCFSVPQYFSINYSEHGTGTTAVADDTEQTYETWEEAYKAVLVDFIDGNIFKNMAKDGLYYSFWSKDLNLDGIPELFLSSPQSTMPSYLYTFYDNKVIQLGGFVKGGDISYCKDENIIRSSGGSAGYAYYQIYKLQNGELELIDNLFSNTIDKYTRNDIAISKSEYDSLIKNYNSKNFNDFHEDTKKLTETSLFSRIDDIYYEYYFDYYSAYSVVNGSTSTEITISNTVDGLPVMIIGQNFLASSQVKTLNIPSNISSFYYYGLNGEHLISINVDANNPWYASKEGVMYSKDMSEIFKFPTGKDLSSYVFPESVSSIGRFAFAWCNGIKKIELPETISIIDDHAFYCCPNLSSITIKNKNCDIYDDWDELTGSTICNSYNSSTNTYNYLGVICGYNNSSAQNYAENFDRTFVSLGDDPAITTTTTTSTTTTTTTTTSTTTTTTTLETTTTTTTTTTAPATTTSVQTMPSQPDDSNLGDANEDSKVDAKDASFILVAYAKASTGSDDGLTEQQRADADVNSDGKVDSKDASYILIYYAFASTSSGEIPNMKEYMDKQINT